MARKGEVKNLAGKKFGRLSVLDTYERDGRVTRWLCKCDCGTDVFIASGNLQKGTTKSCGCLAKEMMSKAQFKDMRGQTFGRLKVIKIDRVEKKAGVFWECECECGNTTIVLGNALRNGTSKSCGCLRRDLSVQRQVKDMVGQRFGRLVVIERKQTRYKTSQWLCICDCGKEKIVSRSSLLYGTTVSCGCYKKESTSEQAIRNIAGKNFKDLEGLVFSKLTVLERKGNSKLGQARWLCLCSCGNTAVINGASLTNGNSKSCGCQRESWIATEVKLYCRDKYKSHSEYPMLLSNYGNLKSDIYISSFNNPTNKDIYIEVNGRQHYEFNTHFYKTMADFKHRKKVDRAKKDYALKNGIYIEIDTRKIKTTDEAISYIEKRIANEQ